MRASAVLLSIVASASVIAACGTGGGDGDVDTGNPTLDYPAGEYVPGKADPTETPTGPIWLTQIASDDGTNVTSAGECLGFTIKTDEYEFEPGATVTLGALGAMPVLFRNATELRVGDPALGYECMWTKPFGPTGTFDLTIKSGTNEWVVEDAITVDPLRYFDVGAVDGVRKWTLSILDDAGANVFERKYDVDVYRVDVMPAIDPTSHVFSHTEFFPTGAPALLPVMEFWDPDHPTSYLARGGLSVVFPMRGVNYVIVRDHLGLGGPTATYELATIRKQGKGTTPSDTCIDPPTLVPTDENRAFYATYDTLTDNFNPDMSEGCADSVYGTGIRSPGNDGVWKISIPAGKSLRVTTYDDHIDNVTFLVPVPTMHVGTSGCPRRINNCVAAAGRFGGGNTDTMIYKNLTDAPQEFLLIHDSATVMTSNVGSFLMNVELFDR